MIVAGSVLALLLMGLAVDGFVNPGDEDADNPTPEENGTEDPTDQSGDGEGLTDMLLANDPGTQADPDAPPDQIPPEGEGEEEEADTVWTETANDTASDDFIEIDALATIQGGEEVAYVETFDTETDTLVLEFDGTAADAPEIDVAYDPEEDATIVFANGLPVTLVEGADGMTPDHVRIVMDGEDTEQDTLPAPDVSVTALEQPIPADFGEDGPQTRTVETQTIIDDPTEVFVDTIEDGVPDDDTLNALLDQVAADLNGSGGTDEMLAARVGIDDAFGTGGEDAQTGSLNADMVLGGDGQDALFGDEGDDTLLAGAGNDELHGDNGNDDMQGAAGIDFLDGGDGHDTLDGGGDRDLLFGGDGDDVLHGGAANDFLQGGRGVDMLNGGSGDDTLDGVFGDGTLDQDEGDVLWGGDGDDHLIIGAGDVAHGGDGADTFVSGAYVETAEVAGRVEDFDPGQDRIEVIFDPQVSPDPTLEVQDFLDGSGADIILNGEVILSVAGAQGLDPNMIDLQAMA